MTEPPRFAARRPRFFLGGLRHLLVFVAAQAHGTSIDPLIWEQLVLDSDLVGIVRVVDGGGVVARYEPVQILKGEQTKAFQLRIPPDYWGSHSQYPLVLRGEHYLITARRQPFISRIASLTSHGGVPLWRRDIPADYQVPLFQGVEWLSKTSQGLEWSAEGNGFHFAGDLGKFRQAVTQILELPEPARTRVLIERLTEKYLSNNYGWEHEITPRAFRMVGLERLIKPYLRWKAEQKHARLRRAVHLSPNVAGALDVLLTAYVGGADRCQEAGRILEQVGRQDVLGALARHRPRDKREVEWLQDLNRDVTPPRPSSAAQKRPDKTTRGKRTDKTDMAELARLLRDDAHPRWHEALSILTENAPRTVVSFLRGWEPRIGRDWREADRAYVVASYFCSYCPEEREGNFLELTRGRNPYVRVAGAVYLAYENLPKGIAILKGLERLRGDPGAWAAISLARRGDKEAMARALEVLRAPSAGGMEGVPHEILQSRVMELLSNSARRIPPPDYGPWYDRGRSGNWEGLYAFYATWWEKNREKLDLADPWLPYLTKQKVD